MDVFSVVLRVVVLLQSLAGLSPYNPMPASSPALSRPRPALSKGLVSDSLERQPEHPNSAEAATPKPPVWPNAFQLDFSEDNFFLWFTLSTKGTYYYDFANGRERVDRDIGKGDRYCGSALPGYDTPCTQLVLDGQRYLIFEKEKYCCKCCSAESGCGVLRPDWLSNATYIGHDFIYGLMTTKWNNVGLQNNYYWHSYDNIPVRIYQEPVTQMTFDHSSYSTPASFDEGLFTIPPSLDCSPACYGVCALLQKQNQL